MYEHAQICSIELHRRTASSGFSGITGVCSKTISFVYGERSFRSHVATCSPREKLARKERVVVAGGGEERRREITDKCIINDGAGFHRRRERDVVCFHSWFYFFFFSTTLFFAECSFAQRFLFLCYFFFLLKTGRRIYDPFEGEKKSVSFALFFFFKTDFYAAS